MTDTRGSQLKRIAGIYDDLAPTWDQRGGLVERLLMGKAIRKHLAAELTDDVLEIGSGTGATLRYVDLQSPGIASFTATDLSPGMLGQLDAGNAKLRLARASADALPFPDATFDVVTCSLVLCTVPDPERALREMSRVCKPGGKLVLLEHVLAKNRLLAALQRRVAPAQVRHMGCHLDRETDRLLRQLGFRMISEERRFFGIFMLSVVLPIGAAAAPA
jgi:ubiquinone/menaquinone biosynthesis C-methylase UbiE